MRFRCFNTDDLAVHFNTDHQSFKVTPAGCILDNITINHGLSLKGEARIHLTNDDKLSNDLDEVHLNTNSIMASM